MVDKMWKKAIFEPGMEQWMCDRGWEWRDKLLEFLPLREKATGRPRVLTKSAIPTIHTHVRRFKEFYLEPLLSITVRTSVAAHLKNYTA